jgi:hypothetical protein
LKAALTVRGIRRAAPSPEILDQHSTMTQLTSGAAWEYRRPESPLGQQIAATVLLYELVAVTRNI